VGVVKKGKSFKPGGVVWVPNVADRDGNVKTSPRPLLIIEPGPINQQSPPCCLSISTDPKDDPEDPAIEMPWDALGGSTTGLFEWCRVVLLWHVLVDQDKVAKRSGSVNSAFLADVASRREQALLAKLARGKK
jgi:hypothetical protein